MKLPSFISKFYSEKRYAELVYFFRALWDNQGSLALKRNRNAVNRIKQAFTQITGRPVYSSGHINHKYWDEQIAKYADRLGVAALIDDMKLNANKRPQSIAFFIYSKHGACRWENMVMQQIEKDNQARKKEENEMYEELGRALRLAARKSEPDWMIQARKRLTMLRRERELTSPVARHEIDREIARIEANLQRHHSK